MHSGELDHRLQIWRLTGAVNSYNESTNVFALYTTVWAKRTDASAGETVRAKEVGASVTAHFRVRYSPQMATVTPKDRAVIEGGLTYNITGVRELQRNQWLEFHAVAREDL